MLQYNDTPFHNFHHAFHVFQNCFIMVAKEPLMKQSMTLLDVFALLVASICHDIDHNGATRLLATKTIQRSL